MRRIFSLPLLLPALVILAFGFAIWGWTAQSSALRLTDVDSFYRAIGSVTLSTVYDHSANWNNDWRLNLARIIGAAAFLLAASEAFAKLLSNEISTYFGRFRRNHLLVVGDHPVARGVVEAAVRRGGKVTWIANSEVPPDSLPSALIVPRRWERPMARQFRADQAARSVVAFGNEVQQIAAVRDLRSAAPTLPITMNFGDAWFAERMDELENISGVRFVSQVQLSVRDLHWRQPPFLIAERLGHQRLHALIFGFGRGGEAVMTDLLLCSLTGNLGKPMVTIVDPRAAEVRRSLAQRCPALGESVDYVVIDPGQTVDVRVLPMAELAAAEARAPISLAYICVDDDARAIALGVSLQAVFLREGWRTGPIFARLVNGGALPDVSAGIAGAGSAGLVGFGATADFAHAIGLFDSDSDALPRLFHDAYRRTAPPHAAANQPWEALAEEFRESNRRLLIHLPAKLATAGVDIATWLSHNNQHLGAVEALPLPDLDSDPTLLEGLAELEHRRWMMERHIGGWQYGATRDNSRRIHPDLKPYAALDDKVRGYDRAMVREAWSTLTSAAGTGFFPAGNSMPRAARGKAKPKRAA
jgi:RyR domain